MSRLQIIRAPRILKWVSFLCNFESSKSNLYVNGSLERIRLYGTESTDLGNDVDFGGKGKKAHDLRAQAQSALVEYFHSTRNFRILDAENMSMNSPEFFDRLMKEMMKKIKVEDGEIKHSITRFLRYHPIDEFEPFFESIGLKPSEYVQFLPRDLMFVADDELLLENYCVLCNYDVQRSRIGKIFKEVNEVFRYDYGVLQQKLLSFENLGLRQRIVAKIIASSPHLLRGNVEFVEFLEKLKQVGVEYDWVLDHIREEDSYNWKRMLQLVCFLCKSGWSEKQVADLFKQRPDLLLECSGRITFGLVGLLLKSGSTMSDVQTFFLQFPQIPVSKFAYNLQNSYIFLVQIKMAAQDINRIVRSYPILLGSIKLKKLVTLMSQLCRGRPTICQMVKDDPFTLEQWVCGRRVEQLPPTNKAEKVRALKTQFLLSLGFEENSKDMEMALKIIRGAELQEKFDCLVKNGMGREEVINIVKKSPEILNQISVRALKTQFLLSLGFEENSKDMEMALKMIRGVELQGKFDCLVKNGMSREEAINIVKKSPEILNQTSDVTQTKIRIFLDDLGYQVSDLVNHSRIICYSIKRLKLRLLTRKWLKDQRAVCPSLALRTIMSCSDEYFFKTYVNSHAKGPEFWKSLNEKHNSTGNK